jgi:HPt (histidine-containing phosphotransfer) domain-containing protein
MNRVYLKYNNFDSLDPSKLDQLINLGKDIDEDVLGQLIAIHKETAEVILKEMNQFFAEKNYDELKRCVHKFKSSSANLGLMRLHNLCHDLENYIGKSPDLKTIDTVSIHEFIEGIAFECGQTNQKLVSYQKVA